ncbi:MAG TPA: VIC family potassium channel protein, partial [Synechococcales bacterium UBA10510]|nr:VIC family potassium channel protein [Synechococcales bacterium UBA10510]
MLRQRRPPSTRDRRPWLLPLFGLILVINLSALGYRITNGWDWGDCY